MKLFTQIKIYLRLLKNFSKVGKKKSVYFFIFSMPLIGYVFFILTKIIISTKSNKLIIFFLKRKIFLSTIRFLDIETRSYIANILPDYNKKVNIIGDESKINNFKTIDLLNNLKQDGYVSLGKIFSDEECSNLLKSLDEKNCFNSQVPMQSNGLNYKFNITKNGFSEFTSAYYCYDPYISLNFPPFKKFITDDNLKLLIENYLKFPFEIYSSQTWINPISKEKHYVHRPHRDHDDYRVLGMVVYWSDVDKNNGCTSVIKKSHIYNNVEGYKDLIGERGTVHLVDFGSLHKGSSIRDNPRVSSWLRFGKEFNYSTVIDCWCTTPLLNSKN